MKKILVTGSSGYLGCLFLKYLKKIEASSERYSLLTPTHKELDVSIKEKVENYFEKHKPNIIVHFAAHRDATTAESQRGNKNASAWLTNVVGTKNIADEAKKYESYFIHISTDYVFSGKKHSPGPYAETKKPEANNEYLSWYGITKREAEHAILQTSKFAIIRINNIVGGVENDPLDYLGKILSLYKNNKLYPLFDDQQITLTYVPLLNSMIVSLIKTEKNGIFHSTTSNVCTPHLLAKYVVEKKFNKKNEVKRCSIDSYLFKNPNRYPKHGGLEPFLTEKELGIQSYTWEKIASFYL